MSRIKGSIELDFPNEEIAKIVYESVLFEHKTVPYRRSRFFFERLYNNNEIYCRGQLRFKRHYQFLPPMD